MNPMINRNKTGFTLVELMVVVGIIGLVTLFAVPAFRGIAEGGRLRSAAFQMNTAVSLARQTAITTRQLVSVLLPDADLTFNQETRQLAHSAYALYSHRDEEYLTGWERLPQGVVIDPEAEFHSGGNRNVFSFSGQSNNNHLEDVPFPNENSGTQTLVTLTFRPDGALKDAGFRARAVYLTAGSIPFTGTPFPEIEGDSTVYGIEIGGVTGQSSIREYNP